MAMFRLSKVACVIGTGLIAIALVTFIGGCQPVEGRGGGGGGGGEGEGEAAGGTAPEGNAELEPPQDGQWSGTVSQGGTIRFRVSNGGTTVSDFFLEYEYRTIFPGGMGLVSESVTWDTPEDVYLLPLPPQGRLMFSTAKSSSSTIVSLVGHFDTPTQASGIAGVTFLGDTSRQDLDLDWTAALR